MAKDDTGLQKDPIELEGPLIRGESNEQEDNMPALVRNPIFGSFSNNVNLGKRLELQVSFCDPVGGAIPQEKPHSPKFRQSRTEDEVLEARLIRVLITLTLQISFNFFLGPLVAKNTIYHGRHYAAFITFWHILVPALAFVIVFVISLTMNKIRRKWRLLPLNFIIGVLLGISGELMVVKLAYVYALYAAVLGMLIWSFRIHHLTVYKKVSMIFTVIICLLALTFIYEQRYIYLLALPVAVFLVACMFDATAEWVGDYVYCDRDPEEFAILLHGRIIQVAWNKLKGF